MPRIRLAIRSGWNTSIWSSFSPTPANLMGFPVTALMDRAAPRASPSSLVRTTPSMSSASLKGLGRVHRVLADQWRPPPEGSRWASTAAFDVPQLVHQPLVHMETGF